MSPYGGGSDARARSRRELRGDERPLIGNARRQQLHSAAREEEGAFRAPELIVGPEGNAGWGWSGVGTSTINCKRHIQWGWVWRPRANMFTIEGGSGSYKLQSPPSGVSNVLRPWLIDKIYQVNPVYSVNSWFTQLIHTFTQLIHYFYSVNLYFTQLIWDLPS